MAAKPFESRIQDLVYNVDVGIGLFLIKISLYFLFIFIVILLYTATQFRGLKDAEAMEYAQLGRNLMTQKSLVTQAIRPSTMWFLKEKSPRKDFQAEVHPDILHPPVYPAMLAGWFALTRAQFPTQPTAVEAGGIYGPDTRIVILNHLFTLIAALLTYLLGRRLFDGRVAFMGVTMYLISDMVWFDSISGLGLSMLTCWVLGAIYTAVIASSRIQETQEVRRALVPISFCVLFCALAFLTRYGAIVLLPSMVAILWGSIGKRGWIWAIGFVLAFLLLISPWLARNQLVSGALLGAAPYGAINGTYLFEEDGFDRALAPKIEYSSMVSALQIKWMTNLKSFYQNGFRNLGEGLLISLFLVTFFYRFVRFDVHVLRWGLALALVLLLLIAALFGEYTLRLMNVFWPLVILYGLAFFVLLLERLQLKVKLLNTGVVAALFVLSGLPMALSLLPPRASIPYPPYFTRFIQYSSSLMRPQELLCTDMPWATAWYGNRSSLLLPLTLNEFYDINDYTRRISGIYFTSITRDKPYVRSLMTGRYSEWFPILEGRLPADFPLVHGDFLANRDQLILTDRPRRPE